MKRFTINDIRSWKPCYKPGRYLPESWEGTALDMLNDNRIPFRHRLWVIMRTDLVSERLMRLFAVWCARQVQHLMVDERSIHALDVMEAYAENRWLIDDPDYAAAWESERSAARFIAEDAARDAALSMTNAVRAAAGAAARDAAEATQEQKLREMLIAGIETGDTK